MIRARLRVRYQGGAYWWVRPMVHGKCQIGQWRVVDSYVGPFATLDALWRAAHPQIVPGFSLKLDGTPY